MVRFLFSGEFHRNIMQNSRVHITETEAGYSCCYGPHHCAHSFYEVNPEGILLRYEYGEPDFLDPCKINTESLEDILMGNIVPEQAKDECLQRLKKNINGAMLGWYGIEAEFE